MQGELISFENVEFAYSESSYPYQQQVATSLATNW